jgi:hypothetical protein
MSKNSPELIKLRNLSTEELHNLYWNKKYSFVKISNLFGVSPGTVMNIFKSRGIKKRTCMEYKNTSGLLRLKGLSNPELFDLYWNKKYSFEQIAKMFKISSTAVRNIYAKQEIKSRTNAESQTAVNFHRGKELSFMQEQLIYGSLLGDACLFHEFFLSNKTGKRLESFKIAFYHSNKFKEYLLHKRDIIGLSAKTKKPYKLTYRVSGMGSLMVGFSYCHSPTLEKVAKICLDSNYKKRLTPEWVEKIDWPALAFWHQDDGCLALSKRGKKVFKSISFHTESFNSYELILLQELLLKFGLDTKIGYNNGIKSQPIILAHKQAQIKAFFDGIRPYITPCELYKLRDSGLFREKKTENVSNSM